MLGCLFVFRYHSLLNLVEFLSVKNLGLKEGLAVAYRSFAMAVWRDRRRPKLQEATGANVKEAHLTQLGLEVQKLLLQFCWMWGEYTAGSSLTIKFKSPCNSSTGPCGRSSNGVLVEWWISFARPKSEILAIRQSSKRSTFSNFKSRCMRPNPWMYRNPSLKSLHHIRTCLYFISRLFSFKTMKNNKR